MNAPATPTAVRPDVPAAGATGLVAWDLIHRLIGFDTHGGSEIAEIGKACNGTHDYGKVSFGTEASLFHDASIPTIICGPGHIAQAHQPNEWVTLDQLAQCEAFMRRLADRVCLA